MQKVDRWITVSTIWLTAAWFVLIAVAVVDQAASDEPCIRPLSGESFIEAVDEIVIGFMCENDILGGVVAVMKDGEIVHERGYGWMDAERAAPMPHDAMMRIASVSKPITAAAVRELIDDGLLSLEDRAFDLGQPLPPGVRAVLPIEPFPSLGDERLKEVTIDHLLQHRGGWKRDEAGDLTYRERQIAEAMGVECPPGRVNTLRYILGRPLEFTPGEERAYSNIGCLVLGLIVEHVTGQDLIDVIHERVLRPLGVPQTEHELGRTIPANAREPFYDESSMVPCVFSPDGEEVRRPYGGWHHEARVGQGGQITTARTLLLFLEARYVNGPHIGRSRSGRDGPNWRRNHTGSLPGTSAIARQRGDGVNFAVILNKRKTGGGHFGREIGSLLDAFFDDDAGEPITDSES